MRLYEKRQWELVVDASQPVLTAGLALLAVYHYLAWCFRHPFQKVALDIVNL